MSISDRIVSLRKKLHITQNDFGHKIGCDQATVSKMEKGELNLTLKHIHNIHIEYGINLNWLVSGTGKMKEDLTERSSMAKEPHTEYGKSNDEINELLRENRQLRLRIEEMEGKKKTETKPKAY